MDTPQPRIRTVRQVVAYENSYVCIYDDHVRFSDGSAGRHLRIIEGDGKPGVVALAIAQGKIALVLSYRYPIRAWEWGLPRGFANSDDPVKSVIAELEEELGAAPHKVQPLVSVTPNSGVLAGQIDIFLCHYRMPVVAPTDTNEIVAVRWERVDRIKAEIADGAIRDGFTIAALGAAYAKGLL